MLDTRGQYQFDSVVHLPPVHLSIWGKLLRRLAQYPDIYVAEYNRCVARGMNPEPSDEWLTQAAIVNLYDEELPERTIEVNGPLWRLERTSSVNHDGAEWFEIRIDETMSFLQNFQAEHDNGTPESLTLRDEWLARICARSLRLMWSILHWRQLGQAEGLRWRVPEA